MAVALSRLWEKVAPSPARYRAIRLFVVHLGLIAAWSPLFFGALAVRAALIVLVVLAIASAVTIIASARVDRIAAWLLAPYLAWVAYATTLNAGIVWMN